MDTTYVEQREQDYWISNSRVSLASVVLAFRDGLAPETIVAECFPTLSLEQVYGAITYYLSHRREVDTYLKQRETEFAALQKSTRDPAFARKLAQTRRQHQLA